jgi:hypothetical protein
LHLVILSVCQAEKLNTRSLSFDKFFRKNQPRKKFFSQLHNRLNPLSRALRPPSSWLDRRGQANPILCRAAQANKMGWFNKLLSISRQYCRNNLSTSTSFLAKWFRSTTQK